MDRLRQHVLLLSNASRAGGRARILDDETIELHDCMGWRHAWTDVLRANHPELELSIHNSRQSLSGFVVVFRLPRERTHWTGFVVLGLLLACCCYVLVSIQHWGGLAVEARI